MRKKFFSVSILAFILLVLSGSGARTTYSASALVTDPCQKACELEFTECATSGGAPFGYCWGQYLKCHNQCRH